MFDWHDAWLDVILHHIFSSAKENEKVLLTLTTTIYHLWKNRIDRLHQRK